MIPTLGWDFDLHQPLKVSIEEVLPATSTSTISLAGAATISDSDAASSTTTIEKDFATPKVMNFFAPLKTKAMRQMQISPEKTNQDELRPDLCIGNVLACDTNKLATIRRPHNPLKCPISQQNEYVNVSRPMQSTQVRLMDSYGGFPSVYRIRVAKFVFTCSRMQRWTIFCMTSKICPKTSSTCNSTIIAFTRAAGPMKCSSHTEPK